MFRSAAAHTLRRAQQQLCTTNNIVAPTLTKTRPLVTSAQKRALNQDQISGKVRSKNKTTTPPPPPSSSSPSATKPPSTTGPTGGGGGSPIVPLAALAAVAAGGAYYMDFFPMGGGGNDEPKKETAATEVTPVSKEDPAPVVVQKDEVKEKVIKQKEEKKPVEKVSNAVGNGNRVTKISAPPSSARENVPPPPVEHDPSGSRVSVEKFSQVYGPSDVAPSTEEAKEEPKTAPSTTTITEAQKELSPVISGKIDVALQQAHATMRATLDETFLKDLEKLSEAQLRIRIVQLASEMGERTKWEAVRLREFLGMKEKEVSDKFVELMQTQRLEFEDLLARRLREQEYQLTKQANDVIDAKDKSMEAVIDAASTAQQAEHEAALKSIEERLERELGARYESEFGLKLAEAKKEFVDELERKLAAIGSLSERLEKTEAHLEISRSFESGSQKAHRVSAAALALAEKMETSKGAMEELEALKSAAIENLVIASAVEKIPSSVGPGVPTLPELQTSFDEAHQIGRQAAYVPSNLRGVEGQLLGMFFASLNPQPSPDSLPPSKGESEEKEDEGKLSDFILSRAKRHVQLGELEEAVNELDKLTGQVSFTVNDWKHAAMDRIAVDKALKVIKLECALMNKNMGG